MKKEMTYTELAKETAILTAAVAIIATAVYFFLVPSHASVSSISGLGIVLSNTAAVVRDHDDLKCCAFNYRIFYLRKGIWREDGLHQCGAAGVSGNF